MEDEVKLHRDLLKTVSVDTRADILKLLDKRQMTASEISRALNKHVTTVSEHLDILKNSNLIERMERPGHKWIYYKLTNKSSQILHPNYFSRFSIILTLSFIVLVGAASFVNANPGDPLYGIQRFTENVRLIITPTEEGKANLHLQYADQRLQEAKNAADKNDTKSTIDTANEYKKEIESANIEIENARKKGQNVNSLVENVDESSSKHISTLENIQKKKPELENQIGPLLDFSKETKNKAEKELSNPLK